MQGRLQGKRCDAQYFLDEVLPHATEACNYLLAVDVEMNTVDGYAMSSWETGYGDFVLRPDLATLRLLPWHPGTALVLVRPRVGATAPRWSPRPARCCAASSTGWPSAGWPPTSAPSSSSSCSATPTSEAWAKGLPRPAARPTSTTSTTRCSAPPGSSRCCARIRNDMTGAGLVRRVGQGRVQPRPARDRVPVRRGAHHLRQARRLQDRRQGDRRPAGHEPHVHGQVRRARGQLVPHPPQPARATTSRRMAGDGPRRASRR